VRWRIGPLIAAAIATQVWSGQQGETARTGVAPELPAIVAAEESRAERPGQLAALLDGLRSDTPEVRAAAARALGRLERRDVVAALLPLLSAADADVRSEAANAVAQALRGLPLPQPGTSELVDLAQQALLGAPRTDAVYRSIARLPYETADQVRAAESFLRDGLPAAGAARGLEAIARLHRRLAPLGPETLEPLRAIAARRTTRTEPAAARRNAMAALLAAQGVDAPTVEAALRDEEFEIRRLAVLVISGAASSFTPGEFVQLLNTALQDRSAAVRLEAARAWARRAAPEHGCGRLLEMLTDSSLHVVLVVLDAIGEACQNEEQVTDRLTWEARTPPRTGPWQREAHAFASLAKRSRERAAVMMPAFARHDNPFVRVYAVRAATAIDDIETLVRLAADPDDNVVEATLAPLRRRLGPKSDELFIAALGRRTRTTGRDAPARPYQVLRAAALQLRGAEPSDKLIEALAGALQRTTDDRCDTSRDTRLALIARIVEFGNSGHAPLLSPLLKDIDRAVAEAAAAGILQLTGRTAELAPQARRPVLVTAAALASSPAVRVEMESGRQFHLRFYSRQAPLAKERFLKLVRERYYNGLTFQRVVPNFVIQGGSPNANEYCGDCPFMRDERGLAMHLRGTVGVSTRGRDTGDAQIFVNLVDNPRLDHEYTVFARVCGEDMHVVDEIHEGDRMRRVTILGKLGIRCDAPY
jgi:cyclophilin family peptidyl-prolyl cis-trans isomerase/HEAT repeat protein